MIGIPDNFCGNTEAAEGNAYAGITTFDRDYGFLEYLQIRLKDELQMNKTYQLSFKIAKAKKSFYKTKNVIGVAFTDSNIVSYQSKSGDLQIISTKRGRKRLREENVFTINFDSLINKHNEYEWIDISLTFKPVNKARYLTVGIFDQNISRWQHYTTRYLKKKRKENFPFQATYHYLDCFKLIKISK